VKHLCFPLLFLLTTSCYFEPDGEYLVNPIPTDFSGVTLDLETMGDTVYLTDYTTIRYSFNDYPDAPLVGVAALLNGTIIYNGGTEGSIFVDPFSFGTGTYKMSIELTAQSNSGSLADKYGLEHVQLKYDITAIISVDLPDAAIITSIDSLNGKLNIHWTPFTKRNFNAYTITKFCSTDNYYYAICDTPITITDSSASTWTDDYFVGGYVQYRIDITASNRTVIGTARQYNYLPLTSFEMVDKKAVIHWSKPKFYANTTSVALVNLKNGSTETATDTVYHTGVTGTFGYEDNRFQITFHSEQNSRSYTFTVPFYVGEYHFYPEVQAYLYNVSAMRYYGIDKINGHVLHVFDSNLGYLPVNNTWPINIPFGYMSENGAYLLTYLPDDPGRPLFRLNTGTLDPSDEFSLAEHFGGTVNGTLEFCPSSIGIRYAVSVGNNGFIALKAASASHVLSLPDYNEIYSAPSMSGPFLLSTSGTYLLQADKVYAFNGSTFVAYGTINTTALTDAQFDADDNLILSYSDNTVRIVSIATLSVIRSISIPLSDFYTLYDPATNRLLCGQATNYCLIEMQTGELRPFQSTYNATLANGKIFARNDATTYAIDQTYFFEP
jgi:hypothetical protein